MPSIPHTETPSWQKPITNFFGNKTEKKNSENNSNCSQIENEGKSNEIQDESVKKLGKNLTTSEELLNDKTECSPDTKENKENIVVKDEQKAVENSTENEPPTKKCKTDGQVEDQ